MKKTLTTLILGLGLALTSCEKDEDTSYTLPEVNLVEPQKDKTLPADPHMRPAPEIPNWEEGIVNEIPNARAYEDFIKHEKAFVDFYKDNCPPCRESALYIEQAAEDYSGVILFGKLECGDVPEVCNRIKDDGTYFIWGVPNFKFFKLGEEIEEYGYVGNYGEELFDLRVEEFDKGWHSRVVELTEVAEIGPEVHDADIPTVLVLSTKTCGSCIEMRPRYERISIDKSDQVLEEDALKVVHVNVEGDEWLDYFYSLGLEYVPTFLFYNKGEQYTEYQLIGALPYEDFSDWIDSFLEAANGTLDRTNVKPFMTKSYCHVESVDSSLEYSPYCKLEE